MCKGVSEITHPHHGLKVSPKEKSWKEQLLSKELFL